MIPGKLNLLWGFLPYDVGLENLSWIENIVWIKRLLHGAHHIEGQLPMFALHILLLPKSNSMFTRDFIDSIDSALDSEIPGFLGIGAIRS